MMTPMKTADTNSVNTGSVMTNRRTTTSATKVGTTSSAAVASMTNVVIVGMGDMAYGLCRLFQNHNYLHNSTEGGYKLYVTKPGLAAGQQQDEDIEIEEYFHDTNVTIVSNIEVALAYATIVILAIPSGQPLRDFMDTYGGTLAANPNDVVLVDVANPDNAHDADLPTILESSIVSNPVKGLRYVKAFNDNGAVDLLLHDDESYYATSKKLMVTSMCGKDIAAVRIVEQFAKTSLGFDVVKIVPFNNYKLMSSNQNSLGKDYIHSVYITLLVFAFSEFYAILRYNVHKGYDWWHLPLQVTNKGICWTAIYNFALCQVPGILGRLYNLYNGKTKTKPTWLTWSFALRKPLGIISLWLLGIHIIMSLLLFNQKYYGKFFIDPAAAASKLNPKGEMSFFFGIIGSGLYAIMGVCSLPSVGNQLTRRTWEFVYGPIAWLALLFGTTHVLIMGVKGWVVKKNNWPGELPPITMISVLIPMLVLFMKIVQYVVCHVVLHLRKQKTSNILCQRIRSHNKSKKVNGDLSNRGDDDVGIHEPTMIMTPSSFMDSGSKAMTPFQKKMLVRGATLDDSSSSGSGDSVERYDAGGSTDQMDDITDVPDDDTNYSA